MKSKRTLILVICLVVIVILALLFLGKTGVRPPISVTFRKSLLDDTRVLRVTNRKSDETLVISLKVVNKEKGRQGDHIFKVGPGKTNEVGIIQMGWSFEPGEEITLEADGYMVPVSVTVP